MKKQWIKSMIILVMIICLGGCSSDDVVDQVANVVQSDDENVLMVKNGIPDAYPDRTYGEAFENFFAYPTWKYYVGTEEGPDEDGDGEPDYRNENVDVVEFTGECMYQDVEVKALIQFKLDKEAGTFEAVYLSFNDVPQNKLMLAGLLEVVFTEESTVTEDVTEEPEVSEEVVEEPATPVKYIGDVGTYLCIDSVDGMTGKLDISNVTENSFTFSLGLLEQGYSIITAEAQIIEDYVAEASVDGLSLRFEWSDNGNLLITSGGEHSGRDAGTLDIITNYVRYTWAAEFN